MRKVEEYSISLSSEKDAPKKRRSPKSKLSIFEIFESGIAAIVVITLLFIFCFRVFTVEGNSMKPTLQPGDKVVISHIGYTPKQGDVIVISDANSLHEPIVKRVIAVGGDVVDINFTTGVVTVNGKEEHYADDLTTQSKDVAFPLTVPEGTVFVLGDNRALSQDSRSSKVGFVDEKDIVGKVIFRFYPIGDWTVE